jgi:diguanylate cyclase (GGDEF)-like protein
MPSASPAPPDTVTSGQPAPEGAVAAALPPNEVARLAALGRYGILDTPAEQSFDDIVTVAAALCHVPIALISLVDEHRQWFKASSGLAGPAEIPRTVAFCAHAILEPDRILEVSDARLDPRFATNPLVLGDPHIRFYAGVPLVSPEGQAVGTLCVIDRVPRQLTAAKQNALASLARQVVAQLELRHLVADLSLRSTTDVLTGAWNRRAFEQRLAAEWNRHVRTRSSLGLLMLDVDHFKHFNDRFGHPAGDRALVQVVQAAQQPLRSIDFLARFGGEEFVMILPDATEAGALEVAERSLGPLTVSVGLTAMRPGQGIDPHTLVARADRALYQAKAAGRNQVCTFERWH